ncbi:MAG: hypothetical protein JW940_17515 [Polyangiaceae bacterium]|nr:hypothetical protein [Polyangiaceae bacterium]
MSDDLLREATRAVRETTEDSGDTGAFTRMRIMHSLHGARRRRMTRVVVWAPLAAILAGATAAAATGQAARVWLAIERAVLSEPSPADTYEPPAARRTRSGSRGPAKPTAPEPATSDTSEPSVAEPEATRAPVTEERVSSIAKSKPRAPALDRDARTASSGLAAAGPSAEDLAAARELDLYRAAHRAHFREHDCPGAIQAWERYLAQAPRGRFTLEARYNRALCLVRLGREDAAAAALRPFAQGSFGGYRQSDARALLEALESRDAGTP